MNLGRPIFILVTGVLGHRGTNINEILHRWCTFQEQFPAIGVRVITSSTVAPELENACRALRFIQHDRMDEQDQDFIDSAVKSRYLQALDVSLGLQGLDPETFVVRVRSDFLLGDVEAFHFQVVRLSRMSESNSALTVLTEGTRRFSLLPAALHFSDFLQIGTCRMVGNFWSASGEYGSLGLPASSCLNSLRSFTPDLKVAWSPEQFGTGLHLGIDMSRGSHRTAKFSHFYSGARAVGRDIRILSASDLGLELPKGLIEPDTLFGRLNMSTSLERRLVAPFVQAGLQWIVANVLFFFHPIWWGMRPQIAFHAASDIRGSAE